MARSKRIRIALVYWLDAHQAENDDGLPGLEQISAGILVRSDRKTVKLAQITDGRDWSDGAGHRDVLTIPRGMVQRIEILKTVTLKGIQK